MNNRDLRLLTGSQFARVRPSAIEQAAKRLTDRDREALRLAEEKRARKRAKALAREHVNAD